MQTPAQQAMIHRQITDAPSEEVIYAVSELSDVDPLDFEQRLHDVVDPDALDSLTDWSEDADVGISFTFESYTVTIEGSELVVEDRESVE